MKHALNCLEPTISTDHITTSTQRHQPMVECLRKWWVNASILLDSEKNGQCLEEVMLFNDFAPKKKQLNCSLSQCVFFVGWTPQNSRWFNLVSFILIHIFALPLVVGESCQGFRAAGFDDDSSSLLKSVARWYFRYSCFPMFGNRLQQFGMPTENSHVLKKRDHFKRNSIFQPLVFRGDASFQGRC